MTRRKRSRPPAAPERPRPPFRSTAGSVAAGFVFGVLLGELLGHLGLHPLALLRLPQVPLLSGLTGAALWPTPARRALGALASLAVALEFAIGFTPLVLPLAAGLVREEPPAPADAVVVLASGIHPDGRLIPAAQARLSRGFELLGSGYAPTLVISRLPPPFPSYRPEVARQMKALRLEAALLETEPARNTREEALAVARIARARRWHRVLLVTEPFHSRRAAAVFERAGVRVVSVPTATAEYTQAALQAGHYRIEAFQQWVRESLSTFLYRRRGWL